MKNLRELSLLCSALLFSASFAACGDDPKGEDPPPNGNGQPNGEDAVGLVDLTIWGGDDLASGISATADGWSVEFDNFFFTVQDATISYSFVQAGEDLNTSINAIFVPRVLDLANEAEPLLLNTIELPQGTLETLDFTNNPVGEHHRGLNIDESLRDLLENAGVSGRVQGALAKGEDRVTFQFDFGATTFYENCPIRMANGEQEEVRIIVDAAQLFRTSLSSYDGALSAQAIANAAVDGHADNAAVDAIEIGSLSGYNASGGDVETLYDFLLEQFRRVVRINGTGPCD